MTVHAIRCNIHYGLKVGRISWGSEVLGRHVRFVRPVGFPVNSDGTQGFDSPLLHLESELDRV